MQAELEFHERKIAKCRIAIEHFDATLVLYEESRNAKVVTRRYLLNGKSGLFAHGYVSGMVAEILRKANRPLNTGEVAEDFFSGLEAEIAPEQRKLLYRNIRSALANKARNGRIFVHHKEGRLNFYAIADISRK